MVDVKDLYAEIEIFQDRLHLDQSKLEFLEERLNLINYLEEKHLVSDFSQLLEKKNKLLTNIVDTDYLEILYRKKFMVGSEKEKIYIK